MSATSSPARDELRILGSAVARCVLAVAFVLAAASTGCPRAEPPAATATSAPDAPASPERTVPASDDHAGIAAEVAALVEEAAAGSPTTVTLAMEYIFGWGCDCPPLVFRASGSETERDEEYVFPVFAEGVADAVHEVRGGFDLVGRYTGRRIDMFRWNEQRGTPVAPADVDPEERPYWRSLHPEFLVLDWCYRPPSQSMTPEWEIPRMTRMRTAGVPLCPGAAWPAWLDEPVPEDE